MNAKNAMSLLLRRVLDPLEVRLVNTAPTKVRGLDPIPDLAWLIDHKRQPVIVDVGANDGETAADFLARFPDAKLFAFEPYAPCCDELRRRFAGRENVRIEHCALGAAESAAQLNVYSGHRMNSLLRLDDQPGNLMSQSFHATGTVDVAVHTLDAYCHEHDIAHIDILKIDTQGYDLEVLKGARELLTARRVRALLLEVNFVPMYERQATFPELHGLLSAAGYRLVDFYNQLRSDGFTAWCDACYVATDPHNPARRA